MLEYNWIILLLMQFWLFWKWNELHKQEELLFLFDISTICWFNTTIMNGYTSLNGQPVLTRHVVSNISNTILYVHVYFGSDSYIFICFIQEFVVFTLYLFSKHSQPCMQQPRFWASDSTIYKVCHT